jgi:hypothetical protein
MRKLAVLLLLVLGCLAVGAWWTAQPRTAEQAMGWCIEQRGQEVTFVRCAPRPLPGSSAYGKVVGVSPQYIDFMGEPPFGRHCPPETDEMVRSPLPSGNTPWLCLDTQPGKGNVRA